MTHIQVSQYRKMFFISMVNYCRNIQTGGGHKQNICLAHSFEYTEATISRGGEGSPDICPFCTNWDFWFMLENSDFMEVTVKFGLFCHPMEIRSSAPDLHYIIKRPTMINFDHQILANGWCVLHSYLLPMITFDFESDESDDKRRWNRRCIISFNSQMSRAASVTMKALLPLENSIKCKTIYIH